MSTNLTFKLPTTNQRPSYDPAVDDAFFQLAAHAIKYQQDKAVNPTMMVPSGSGSVPVRSGYYYGSREPCVRYHFAINNPLSLSPRNPATAITPIVPAPILINCNFSPSSAQTSVSYSAFAIEALPVVERGHRSLVHDPRGRVASETPDLNSEPHASSKRLCPSSARSESPKFAQQYVAFL